MKLATRGVMTLVDHASPARLREAYLRLRARDPATDVIVDVRRLAELPVGATAILALTSATSNDDLDWLNLNRPIVSDRRLNIVLWCEGEAAAALSWRAPDFFDWISARIDCPPAPAAHAIADVKRAICTRACGIAWLGPGLEETLAAVRPGRPIRRVAVASYQSMLQALTSHEPGWLFLDGIETAFHLRRLQWAMAETGRRLIVFRRGFARTPPGWRIAPGWQTVHAMHASIAGSVQVLTVAGGTGRLAALAGLDPEACLYARFALRRGIEATRLEELLATAPDPWAALQDLAGRSGWLAAEVLAEDDSRQELVTTWRPSAREVARPDRDDDPVVLALRGQPLSPERWAALGRAAEDAGDFEVAIRWLTAALQSLPDDALPQRIASLHVLRGRAHRGAGDLNSARVDLEYAYSIARGAGDAPMIALSAASLTNVLLAQGGPLPARTWLESVLSASAESGEETAAVAILLDMLGIVLMVQGDLDGARIRLERALSIKRKVLSTEDHSEIAGTLDDLGRVLEAQGDMEGARSHFERSLEISERLLGPDHPKIVNTLQALARVHRVMRDASRASAHLKRALALQRVIFGSDEHPDIAGTLVELALVIADGGDLDGAQAMLEQALATQQKSFGNDGQLAGATTHRALANVLVAKGDLVGACEHLERGLAIQRRIFELDDHPEVAATLHELERLQGLQRELERT
jgi:tetratricopeptide (TPR) repeat protein